MNKNRIQHSTDRMDRNEQQETDNTKHCTQI